MRFLDQITRQRVVMTKAKNSALLAASAADVVRLDRRHSGILCPRVPHHRDRAHESSPGQVRNERRPGSVNKQETPSPHQMRRGEGEGRAGLPSYGYLIETCMMQPAESAVMFPSESNATLRP